MSISCYNETMKEPKVAIIHDYLIQYGGAEKTLEALLEIYPEAPIYTGIYKPDKLSAKINNRKILASKNSLFSKFPKHFTFAMPLVFEGFDLREFDIVISEGTSWPKGVLTTPEQLHISYIHTPPRFLYKYSVESSNRTNWYYKPFVAVIDHFLRIWDYTAAQRPDFLIANSKETQMRVKKFYGRGSEVIYPPVDIEPTQVKERNNLKVPYYLAVGRLSAYKNLDLLVQAFNLLGLPLVIIGIGNEEQRLKKMAKPNITFLGQASDEIKREKISECLGLIFPVKDEDFGIVPVEFMAYGKPVLAHRSGGVLETIREGIDGMFFDEITLENFVPKMKEFDKNVTTKVYNPQTIKEHTQMFNKERFKRKFKEFVDNKWGERA